MDTKQNAALFGRDTIVGILFILSIGAVAAIGNYVLQAQVVAGNITDLGTGIQQLNIGKVIWAIASFIAITALVMFWTKATPWIGKLVGVKNAEEPKVNVSKKFKVIPLFLFGILISIILYAFVAFVGSLSPNTNITNIQQLQTAAMSGNIILLAALLVSFAAIGFMTIWFGKHYQQFEKGLPDTLQK